jgi:uncharacterized membrane protein
MTKLGQCLFGFGLAGLGVLSLRFDDFALVWQPVPAGVPHRETLAYLSGGLLLLAGLGIFVRRAAAWSALVLTLFALSWLLLLQVPRVATNPLNEGMWLGFGENLLLVTGGWCLYALLSRRREGTPAPFTVGNAGLRAGQILFGIALPLIGLSHFVYAEGTAGMVPAWLPRRIAFAYLTGSGHILAGLGIVFAIVPRLAATLEAAMLSLFVLLIHAPGVAAAPHDRLQWTMLFVASAYTGAAWSMAASLFSPRWGLANAADDS